MSEDPSSRAEAPRLSVCIIARDEEDALPRCLESVSFADECIVVVDDQSRDATESIARAHGAHVLVHAYDGNIEQKNRALASTRGEWVLALDADEAVTPALAREIEAVVGGKAAGAPAAGYWVNRVTHHLGRWDPARRLLPGLAAAPVPPRSR